MANPVFGSGNGGIGVTGTSNTNIGVHGRCFGNSTAVFGLSAGGWGVHGVSTRSYGVHGYSDNDSVQGHGGIGVYAVGGYYGVYSVATNDNGTAVYARAPGGESSRAGYFSGTVIVDGNFTVQSGNKLFKIDHPLDPPKQISFAQRGRIL